jgi:hypothetical protein
LAAVYGPVLVESPVRDVLCPGCLLGCDTPAESDAELESDIELESVGLVLSPGIVMLGCRPRMPLESLAPSGPVLSRSARPGTPIVSAPPTLDVSMAPTRPGCAVVSTPAVPLYPDVSGRVSRVVDVSCAASRGAKTPTASAVIRAVS